MKEFWNFIVEAYNANTSNKVAMIFVLVILIGLILFWIRDAKLNKELQREANKYLEDNQKRISEIRIRIMTCDNLKDWPNVKNWAIAAANNIRSEIFDIEYNYGQIYGNRIVKDITNMVFRKEEELIRKTFKE